MNKRKTQQSNIDKTLCLKIEYPISREIFIGYVAHFENSVDMSYPK